MEAPARERPDPIEGIGRLQPLAKALVAPLLRGYFPIEVRGGEHVPTSGPAVLAPNHVSMWDPVFLVLACTRPVLFMGMEDVFDSPLKRWAFTRLGGFPVRRGGRRDVAAMRRARGVLRSGKLFGIYPEGTRHRGIGLGPFKTGAAWIALTAGAPLVPVATRGTEAISGGGPVPRRAPVRVSFGEPILVEAEKDGETRRTRADELTEELRDRVAELLAS